MSRFTAVLISFLVAGAASAQAYPNIAMLSPYLTDRDGDARFGFGLGVILDGLEQRQVP